MAITNIANSGQKYNTGYNPLVFVVDSDNKDLQGFRYIFDVYSGQTDTLLASYQIAPRIDDGYGVLHVEKVLQNYLTYNFNTSSIPQSFIQYEIKVGESYGSSWSYNDYQFFSATGTTNNGYTELYNTGTTHSYVEGDQIFITQSDEPTSAFPPLSGLHTVRFVPDPNSIVIDLVYVYANPGVLISGTTVYADNSRIVDRGLYRYSGNTAFNGVVPFVDKYFEQEDYIMSGLSTTRKFLTTCPDGIYKTPYEDMYFNIINNKQTFSYYLLSQNDNGDAFRATIVLDELLTQVRVGPNNVAATTVVAGTAPLIKPDTLYYDVWITNNSLAQVSEKKRIYLDWRCIIDYGDNNGGNISICFLDRLGSFGSFAFQLLRQDRTNIKRDNYNKQTGYITSNRWDYSLTDNGNNIYNVNLERSLTLNTNWMTEADAHYFDELMTSPVTFIKLNDVYQRCEIADSSTETSYQRNKRLIRKTITVNISNNNEINI